MKKLLAGLLIGTVAALTFTAAAFAKDLTKVQFRLDWKSGGQHSPWYLGVAKGFFEDEGIDLDITSGSGSAVSIKQLGSEAIDFALIDAPVLVQGITQGVPVKSIGVYYQNTPITIMWNAAKTKITKPQDLKGKKLGVKMESSTFQGYRVFAEAQDIKNDAVKLVPVGFGVAPLLAGQVDAMMAFTMNEPIEAKDQGMNVDEMLISDYGVSMYGLTISTNETMLKKKKALVDKFYRATVKSINYAAAHPDEAITALKKAVPDVNTTYESQVLKKILASGIIYDGGKKKGNVAVQSDDVWAKTEKSLVKLELIKKEVPVSELMYKPAK